MEMKFCMKCQSVKAVTLFSKKSASPDGLQQYCKECNKKDNDQYRIDKPEFFKEWYNKNAENKQKAKANTKKSVSKLGGGVYAIVNKAEAKMYIGCTNQFLRRKGEHFSQKDVEAIEQNQGLKTLYRDMQRLGKENFEFMIIEKVKTDDPSVLFKRENFWLNFFGNEMLWIYNINLGNSKNSKYYEIYPGENL
jgi:hypothetical protein